VLGHTSTRVTSATYRHRTTPTVDAAAGPMEALFRGAVKAVPIPTLTARDDVREPCHEQ
jgi:hypothetical protein